MFERGPAFAPKPNFRGAIVASYAEDANPLASGYLLHPERIEGKAAAIEVAYGDAEGDRERADLLPVPGTRSQQRSQHPDGRLHQPQR